MTTGQLGGYAGLQSHTELACGVFHRQSLEFAGLHDRHAFAHRALQDASGAHGHRGQHAYGVVAHMRNETAGGQGTTVDGWRDQGHLGVVFGAHIAQAHQDRHLQTQGFDAGFEFGVGVHRIDRFISSTPHVRGFEQHQGHAVVNAGDIDVKRLKA